MEIRFEVGRRYRSAADWVAGVDPDKTAFRAVVDNADACACGGRDGVIVAVSHCPKSAPTAHNMVMVLAFSHHAQNTEGAFLTTEEAKQLVNRLGEAISVAERVARDEQ